MANLNGKELVKRYNSHKGSRANWDDHWQDVAEFVLPRKSDINTRRSTGDKRGNFLFDSTAMKSCELLASALHFLLTNPNVMWFELTTGNADIDDQDDVRLWLQDTTKDIHNVLNNSNFQTEVHEMYLDLSALGTAPMLMEEDDKFLIRFSSKPIDSCYISESNRGVVDELYRDFEWTARQIVQEFGEDNLPRDVAAAFKSNDDKKFTLIHAVYPRVNEADSNFPFISQTVLLDGEHILREGGFNEFPFVVPRWSKTSREIYGRSPGMTALADAKTLNKMTEVTLKGAQKVVDPPLQVTDDGLILPIRTRPGSINFRRPGSDPITPIYNDARIDFGFEAMRDRRERIKEAFFVDQLNLQQGPQMTATEVLQRTEDSIRLLAPILARMQHEFLRPLIDRVFEIMERRGMIRDVPETLSSLPGGRLDVQYSSPIARAQKISEAQNIIRGFEIISPFITLDPTSADLFHADNAVKTVARAFNWPQQLIRNEDEVQQLREQRQQAQQQAQQQQAVAQASENASNVAPALDVLRS